MNASQTTQGLTISGKRLRLESGYYNRRCYFSSKIAEHSKQSLAIKIVKGNMTDARFGVTKNPFETHQNEKCDGKSDWSLSLYDGYKYINGWR